MPDNKEGKKWLKSFLEIVREGIVVIQEEDIVLVNQAFADMLDYEEEDLLDLSFEDLVDTLSRRHDRRMLDTIVSGEGLTVFNTRLVSKDGDIIHVEVSPTNVALDEGPAVLLAIRDLSRQLALETQVTELENRFATLYDMSPIAYFTVNRSGIIEQVNQAAEELLGCTGDEIFGQPLSKFFPKREYDASADILREVFQEKVISGIEIEMQRYDEKIIWVSISSKAFTTGTEKPNEIGLTAFNISRRRAAEDRLREESRRASLYLEAMTSDLNIINQNTIFALEELKLTMDFSEQEDEIMDNTSQDIRRASRLIANIGALMTLRKSPPGQGKTDLYPHLRRAVREVDRDFERKTLEVDSNIEDDVFEVAGHAFLWNIFFNIIYSSTIVDENEPVHIEVRASNLEEEKMIRIEFSDRSSGIPEDQKDFVFKWAGGGEGRATGRGLGLSVVEHYVRDLGGQIWVEDRIEGDHTQGSRIVVLLPRWEDELELPSILFYKSEHCVFCGPMLEMLIAILDELGINRAAIELINIDDPEAGVSEADFPAMPTIKIGGRQLFGFVPEDELRSNIMTMLMFAGT